MLRVLARFAVAAIFAALAAVPIAASAAGGGGGGGSSGMTITIGRPITLQNRLLVTVPVTVTCVAPITIDPNLQQPGFLGAFIEEANRTTVSHGTGGLSLVSCSPSPQTFDIQVTPDIMPSTSPPFHRGRGIVMASGGICDNNFPQTCYFGSTPWQTVRIG